jgi:hypothetical protein
MGEGNTLRSPKKVKNLSITLLAAMVLFSFLILERFLFWILAATPGGVRAPMGRRKNLPGFVNTPGVSITPSPAAAAGAVAGFCLPGLSGTI